MITAEKAAAVWRQAHAAGLIAPEDTTVIFLDGEILRQQYSKICDCFPADAWHAPAIKSNPLLATWQHLHSLGAGAEAASIGEVAIALAAGIPAAKIVYDSPAKHITDLRWLQEHAPEIYINADSLDELSLHAELGFPFRLGLRINTGEVVAAATGLQVSGADSKFGEDIANRQSIIEAFSKTPVLSGLHVHVGSQLQEPAGAVSQVRAVVDLALDVRKEVGAERISYIDIGGGVPVDYQSPGAAPLEEMVSALRVQCPELFDGTFRLITEIGRWMHAPAAFTVIEVAVVKQQGEQWHAILHAGADLFLREAYQPGQWFHRMAVLRQGEIVTGDPLKAFHLGGPLCFGGDQIDRNRQLPVMHRGDHVLILDTGANSFALWSRHCSRAFPKVVWVEGDALWVVRERESSGELTRFWGS